MDPTHGRRRAAAQAHASVPAPQAWAGSSSAQEMRRLIRRLTDRRGGFFREPQHFVDLQRRLFITPPASGQPSVWSAGCGSGEEAYSIAMLLADKLGDRPWRVVGTDPSPARIATARRALYPLDRARLVPEAYLRSACLRGTGEYEGQLLISPEVRERTRFEVLDLDSPLPADWPAFDAIFLRHALAALDAGSRAAMVQKVLGHLKPDGVLYTGNGVSLASLGLPLRELAPDVHRHA